MGREFDNSSFHNLATQHGLTLRFSCPHTSSQNGKAERMIRRLNEIVLALLYHASLPPKFWVEALHTATYLHNILPTKLLHYNSPSSALFLKHPTYDHLRTFGCLCYPNLSANRHNKLDPRSTRCIFLGYPTNYRGYRCLELSTGKVILSRHVTFDEHVFPFASKSPPSTSVYTFLDPDFSPTSPLLYDHFGIPTDQFGIPPDQSGIPPDQFGIPPIAPTNNQTTQPQPPPPTAPPPPPTQPPSTAPTTPPPQPPTPTAPPTTQTQPPPPTPTTTPTPPPPPPPTHRMSTRAQHGIFKPQTKMNLHVTDQKPISPLPKSPLAALQDPDWTAAMNDEYCALISNNTWELVPRPSDASIIRCMWLFRHKFHSDGSLQRYKARLVVNGKTQQVGIDCDETFSPVVKPTTIRTVLSLATSRSWPIHQLDVKNAFLHGDLNETVFMHQPPGFVDRNLPNHVCRLRKSLYGLKQAPRAWFQRFATFILSQGFHSSVCDPSLFIYRHGPDTAYLLLYVDDIVLTASNTALLNRIIASLSKEFAMSDLGSIHHFLGINVTRDCSGLFLSQSKYAKDILARASMSSCNSSATPVDTSAKMSATAGPPVEDPSLYRSLAGALQYLTITRPDITYAVQQICLFMHDPREPHLHFLKRVLRYVKGTINYGINFKSSTSTNLTAYSDADWAGCPDSRRSTSGYCVFLGENLISWSSKRQATISRSSAEAEYRGVANAVAETSWLRNLLLELNVPVRHATLVYCDNISAIYLSGNPVQHQRTKHVELDIHFVREKVQVGEVRVLHVPSEFQYADIFTKGLPRHLFNRFRSSLSVQPPPAPTAGV